MYKFPTIAFVQTYGLTEAGPRVTTLPIQKCNEKVGSVGRAISGVEIKIIDRTGRNLAYGEIGEVLIKSKSIMKGYFRDSEETEKILHSEWLYSGDIGYLSEDGYLYIIGRKKNVIISGGLNICPEEIEEIIMNFEGVVDVIVFGEYDNLLGEVVCADIVVENNDTEIVEQLRKLCAEKLSDYKIPKKIRLVDKIERTYNGKIKRVREG